MKISRILTNRLKKAIQPGKVVVLYGPRRSGKTTLLKEITSKMNKDTFLQVEGDQLRYRELLSSQDSRKLKDLVEDKKLLVIDEAQRIPEIGLNLKILVDNFPKIAVLATGSASLDLAGKISEPLTGRSKMYMLYPLSFAELADWLGKFEAKSRLEQWLIYGSYPEVVTIEGRNKKEEHLDWLISNYLYRDLLNFGGVKKPDKIVSLLRLLAFQIGGEVSIAELGSNLALDRVTVEKYLDLLEKSFVIFKVYGFSRNLRKEIAKTSRYYFFDNGVRNALIENFNDLKLRNDIGQLWENFLAVERRKYHQYEGIRTNSYFWRTYDQKEIDLVEERGGRLYGFEFKWGKGKVKPPKDFLETYSNSEFEIINKENYLKFVGVN